MCKNKFIALFVLFTFCFSLSLTAQKKDKAWFDLNHNGKKDIYEDSNEPTEKRVDNLLSQMTFEEKQGQLMMALGWKMYDRKGDKIILTEDFYKEIKEKHTGSLWGFLRADPWSGKTLQNALSPDYGAKAVSLLQIYMMDSTRLGIPLLLAEEAMHGLMEVGTSVFPTGIGQASTWNTDLIEDMAVAIRQEATEQNIDICFGPLLDLALEPRWSRVEETYGEDTYLTSQMGVAFVSSLSSDLPTCYQPDKVITTLKHFAAYGMSEGGHNGGSAHIGKRELNQRILPPFKSAIKAGAQMVMSSYNEIDGVPCTCNNYLLQEVLRDKWNFNGVVISDLHSISGLTSHGVAENLKQAAQKSICAGVDIDLSATDFYNNLSDVDAARLNDAVRRVLTLKFNSGVFDKYYLYKQIAKSKKSENIARDDSTALNVAREGIVLLENHNNILPLNPKAKQTIALIGPNADNVYNQLGDYTAPQRPGSVCTLKEGLEQVLKGAKSTLLYSKGCSIRDTSHSGFASAIDIAKKSDIVVMCLGGSSSRYSGTDFAQTGAAKVNAQSVNDISCGEGYDRSSLQITGVQEELLKAIKQTGKPIILVLINGRPLLLNWEKDSCDAILEAWYPGMQGGRAIAEILFGKTNPSGRIPISFPRSEGALPDYYATNQVANRSAYLEGEATALYPFGYGLSYTTFSFSNPYVMQENERVIYPDTNFVVVKLDVTNTGDKDGATVAMLWLTKPVSDYARPKKELKAFKKVFLKKGEQKTIFLDVNKDSFTECDQNGNFFPLKGTYTLEIEGKTTTLEPIH